tara:strand:- start:3485 stop:3943 length:459 start_codon:yes stop_codon:yes gene_type:complete
MPIRLAGLVNLKPPREISEDYPGSGELPKETLHDGASKSGLDWDVDENDKELKVNYPEVQEESTEEQEELVEMYEGDVDNRPLKSYIMSIHKMAAELYNQLDETDDPEDWVMERAKKCDHLLNTVYGHVSYAKNKVEELDMEVRDSMDEKGW